CKALLFDDVLWVKRARQEHDVFVDALRERGVTVHLFGELLAETLALPEGRDWLLDRRVDASIVGYDMVGELRGWLDEMPAEQLASLLVGGIARAAGKPAAIGRLEDAVEIVAGLRGRWIEPAHA
ncbi:arginine deiminase family protein, partial [Shinella yambaruensis]